MKYLGYIQFIVLVLFIWLGWQIIDRITFREEMITPLGAALQSAKNIISMFLTIKESS